MGHSWYYSLPVWNVDVVHRLNYLPCHLCLEQMEGAIAQVGSCSHLLAYCRFLLAYHFDSDARSGILGMEPFHLYLDLRHCRNRHELRKTQGSQQLRNDLFCRNGVIRTRGFQAIDRFGFTNHSYLDYRRGRLLHYGSRFLQHQQEAIYAFGIPFLCFSRKRLPHYRSLGYPHEIHLVFYGNISHQESLLYINFI